MITTYASANELITEDSSSQEASNKVEATNDKVGKQMTGVVATPFRDLNLSKEEIPPVLEQARKEPYAIPVDVSCHNLNHEIEALTIVLGADLDAKEKGEISLANKGSEVAGKAAISALSKTVEGAIPYRGWIKKLTGAEKHAKKVDAAIKAGTARRSFLKGYTSGVGCVDELGSTPKENETTIEDVKENDEVTEFEFQKEEN